jgi:hypothetical protein
MIFHDPDTLHLWINVFFAVAAAAVVFAVVAVTAGIRELRRPVAHRTTPVLPRYAGTAPAQPARHAA